MVDEEGRFLEHTNCETVSSMGVGEVALWAHVWNEPHLCIAGLFIAVDSQVACET